MNTDILSLVMDTLLAGAALVIAVIQFLEEHRERKAIAEEELKRQNEKEQVARILKNLDQLEGCRNIIKDTLAEIDDIANKTGDPAETCNALTSAITKYEDEFQKNKATLRDLYNALLANEDKFPMAYGYGRYIEDLREILNYDKVIRNRRIAGYDRQVIEYSNLCNMFNMELSRGTMDEKRNLEYSKRWVALLYEMMDSLEPMYEHGDKLSAVIYELRTKYSQK